jgi:hypothetical protein
LPGKKKTSARGVSHAHPLLFFKFLLYFILLASFYIKNTQKISFLLVVILLVCFLVFLKMSNPEVEVWTFKQQGGDSLKDA